VGRIGTRALGGGGVRVEGCQQARERGLNAGVQIFWFAQRQSKSKGIDFSV